MDATTATIARLELTIRAQQTEISDLKAANRERVSRKMKDELEACKAELDQCKADLNEASLCLKVEQGISNELKQKLSSTEADLLGVRANLTSNVKGCASRVMEAMAEKMMRFFSDTMNHGVLADAGSVLEAVVEEFLRDGGGCCTKDMLMQTAGALKMKSLQSEFLEKAGKALSESKASAPLYARIQKLQDKVKLQKDIDAKMHAANVEFSRVKLELRNAVEDQSVQYPPEIDVYCKEMEAEMRYVLFFVTLLCMMMLLILFRAVA